MTALIGPSGCGKSTFLRVRKRRNDLISNVTIDGNVFIDGVNIYEKNIDVVNLRKSVGMVFQKSNLFPKSIYANLIDVINEFGAKIVEVVPENAFIFANVEEGALDRASVITILDQKYGDISFIKDSIYGLSLDKSKASKKKANPRKIS